MFTVIFVAVLAVVANIVKEMMDQANHDRDAKIRMLDINVKAYSADMARAKAADEDMKKYPPLLEVADSYQISAKALGIVKPLALATPVASSDHSVVQATPVVSATPIEATATQDADLDEPISLTEPSEIQAAETVILVVGPGARVVIGSYPEFGMRLATLVAPGINEKIKMFDASEDEEQVICEADLLGRSRLKALRTEAASTIEATNFRVM